MEATTQLEIRWQGPFAWPDVAPEGKIVPLDKSEVAASSGIYLWSVEYRDGYLIYATGVTQRPFRKRFREHTVAYRSGVYTVFDITFLKQGIRNEVWPGFWFGKRTPEMQCEYEQRFEEIQMALQQLLSNYRIFVASVAPVPRTLARLEAAIMNALYAATGAAGEVPDRGMALAPRWPNEPPIRVRSISPVLMHGLPTEFDA